MDAHDINLLKERWQALTVSLSRQFEEEPDLQALLFLIGVRELGKGPMKYSKDEKQDLMHIAVCRLLSRFGHYELEGTDEDGWPHWKLVKALPPLTLKEQDLLLKQAVLLYWEEEGL
ncbi:MAG: hypothetical protein RL213_981 [Bacteroidota bacterium]|jgi:hypothetical protein